MKKLRFHITVIEPSQYMSSQTRLNAIVAKQWLWRSEEDFETESLLCQSLSFIQDKQNLSHRRIHAYSFKIVQKQKSMILT